MFPSQFCLHCFVASRVNDEFLYQTQVKKYIIKTSYKIMHFACIICEKCVLFDITLTKVCQTSGRRNRYFDVRISQSCWRRKSSYWREFRFIVKDIQVTGLVCTQSFYGCRLAYTVYL